MITEQRSDYLKIAISLNREGLSGKYRQKILEFFEKLQKQETIDILLDNDNIKKIIKTIEQERGIWMSKDTIHKEIDKFFI